jgi:hypothetical protein
MTAVLTPFDSLKRPQPFAMNGKVDIADEPPYALFLFTHIRRANPPLRSLMSLQIRRRLESEIRRRAGNSSGY